MVQGDNEPIGFGGPVQGFRSLVPAAQRVLRLPCATGPTTIDEGPFDLVEVRAVTESLGRFETLVQRLAAQLDVNGTLLLDIDNAQSARALRCVVEGRPGTFDPADNVADPTVALPLRRALAALAGVGLWIDDVVRVPTGAQEFRPELANALMAAGLLPVDWLGAAPPARFWLVASRRPALAGSVLLAGADELRRARTAARLRSILPADWEVVTNDAHGECTQWNRGIREARGDLLWFVRAGSEFDATTFAALCARAGFAAAAPGDAGARRHPGDLSGLMLPRQQVLLVGPLPESFDNTQIALEEYAMRLDTKLPAAELVEVPFTTPVPPVERPQQFAAEAQAMVERWRAVEARTARCDASPARTPPPAPWAGREPRVTLCMIARNEQRFLADCLAAARDAVDEIVVVDTGSTDATVAIAESFGARVLHSPWQDDFSAPRNVGIAAATGDWILVLDADECIQPGGCARIRELVRDPNVLGYHLRFVNVYGEGRTLGVMMVRLFRNLPGIGYENVIHEQVTPSLQRIGGPLGLVLAAGEVEVEHYGYTDEVMDQRGKNERNERLFRKQLAAAPDDVYGHYKYGDFLRRVPGRGDDAKRLLDRCFELILGGAPTLPRELPYAGEVAALCALEAERRGESTRAREVVDLALRRFVPTPNLHYIAASLALADGRAADAIHHYQRCLAYRGQVLVVPIQEGITGHVAFTGIAQAHLLRGDHERARRLLEQAIALEPSYEIAHLALSRLALARGDNATAVRVLNDFLARHPDAPGACQQLALILQRLGQTQVAKRIGRRAVDLLEARALDREAAAMNELLAAF